MFEVSCRVMIGPSPVIIQHGVIGTTLRALSGLPTPLPRKSYLRRYERSFQADRKEAAVERVYTVGSVAELLNVSPSTVKRWFDSGKLMGYRIPGGQEARIPGEGLSRWLTARGSSAVAIDSSRVYFSGAAADAAGVSVETIKRAIRSGQLYAYHVNAGQDRRISRGNLLRFLREEGLTVEVLTPCRLDVRNGFGQPSPPR